MTRAHARAKDLGVLAGLTLGAFFLDGYHPGVEDAEIYLPGILKRLHPALFPYNSEFFESHAHMTLFPQLIAGSLRPFHVPVGIGMLAWQLLCIFLFLLASWRIAKLCFRHEYAVWCAVTLIGSLLRLSAAGTGLYVMDEYLTPRSFSTPAALFAVSEAMEGNYVRAGIWAAGICVIHPLMAVFVTAFVGLLFLFQRREKVSMPALAALALPLFPQVTPAYREVLQTRPYFFLTIWAGYEWLGLLAPFAILAWMAWLGRRKGLHRLRLLSIALIAFEAIFFAIALVVSLPGRFENLAELQPMRCLHLLYVLMFILGGGLLGTYVLRDRTWRWAILFVPLWCGIVVAQRATFPASAYVEWPGARSRNAWVQAFDWIRTNTPENAYFAMDPNTMQLPDEDEHGFRAIAQRSLLADNVKDSGAVSMFPALAEKWKEQVTAQRGWTEFRLEDFQRLRARYSISWIVLEQPGIEGLACPYANWRVRVCRIEVNAR